MLKITSSTEKLSDISVWLSYMFTRGCAHMHARKHAECFSYDFKLFWINSFELSKFEISFHYKGIYNSMKMKDRFVNKLGPGKKMHSPLRP